MKILTAKLPMALMLTAIITVTGKYFFLLEFSQRGVFAVYYNRGSC